ncbi:MULTISPECIES: Txe/YoeB family addiction module toxin [Halomonadaceae]|uniref:Putative mRNA interferase YoeB n=2 Tax=Vreelandella TaxID=3137766 RepID=A0A7Z0LSC6_9GAMM|nr:Txe/YoeB family addiction module toxin [Halomonas sp. Alg239-R46]NYS77704.1 Txe/YoeB family addiction module toxin [Halomonas glaciei]
MKLLFSENAWEGTLYWQKTHKKVLNRINKLIKEIKREPLKHSLAGYWSRRIKEEHRMVYKVTDDALLIAQLRYHY